MITVFTCADQFDDMMTCVYDAWASRLGHANVRLLTEPLGTPELFCTYRHVDAQPEKAASVVRTIRQKISSRAVQMVYRTAMAEQEEKLDVIYRFLILGFHLGTLGLLTEFEKNDLEKTVLRLVKGEYVIEERMTLRITVDDGEKNVFDKSAINDCVLSRGTLSKVAYIDLYINGAFVDTYPCDGIIVSTQTGSTAYSLSVGGPIVLPESKVLIIAPIAPHNLNVRPLIVPDSSVIEIGFVSRDSRVLFTADNRNAETGALARIRISKAGFPLNRIKLDGANFINALTGKLFWGEDIRNGNNQ